MKNKKLKIYILLTVLSAVVLFFDLGRHDVINVNEASRIMPSLEMKDSGDWVVPKLDGKNYLTKPALIYWILGATYKLTGSHSEFVSRIPTALFGIITVLLTFHFGARFLNTETGFIAAVSTLTSYYCYERFQLAELDGPLVFTVLLGIYAMLRAEMEEQNKPAWWYISFFAWALAFLLKWVVFMMFFIPAIGTVVYIKTVQKRQIAWIHFALGIILFMIISAPWCIMLINKVGYDNVINVLKEQGRERFVNVSKINYGSPVFYVIQTPAALMPWTFLLLSFFSKQFWKDVFRNKEYITEKFLLIFCSTTFIAFSLVKGKETEYLLPLHPFLLMLGAAAFQYRASESRQIAKTENALHDKIPGNELSVEISGKNSDNKAPANFLYDENMIDKIEKYYFYLIGAAAILFPLVFIFQNPLQEYLKASAIAKVSALFFPAIGFSILFIIMKYKKLYMTETMLIVSVYVLLLIIPVVKDRQNDKLSFKPLALTAQKYMSAEKPLILYKIKKPHAQYYFYTAPLQRFDDKHDVEMFLAKYKGAVIFSPDDKIVDLVKSLPYFEIDTLKPQVQKKRYTLFEMKRKE